MNLRTITFWALYDPKRKEIVRMARFKKMFTRYSQAFVLVKLKGHYVKGGGHDGRS